MREDIIGSLALRSPVILLSSFDRPNIFYSVRLLSTSGSLLPSLTEVMAANMDEHQRMQCAIVYALKRDTVEQIARHLSKQGASCRPGPLSVPCPQGSESINLITSWALQASTAKHIMLECQLPGVHRSCSGGPLALCPLSLPPLPLVWPTERTACCSALCCCW